MHVPVNTNIVIVTLSCPWNNKGSGLNARLATFESMSYFSYCSVFRNETSPDLHAGSSSFVKVDSINLTGKEKLIRIVSQNPLCIFVSVYSNLYNP